MNVTQTHRHEAGHAVIAALLGEQLVEATVVPTATTNGSLTHQRAATCGLTLAEYNRNVILIALAGRAACGQYLPHGDGCVPDDHTAWSLAREIVGTDPADAPKVGTLIAECWREVQGLVTDYSEAIAIVARSLALHQTLTGDRLERHVGEAIAQDRASPIQQRQRDTRQAFWRWMKEQGGSNGREG